MLKILLVFGTRPEAIKMAPLYTEFRKHPKIFDVKVCVTAQHREMLDQVLKFFCITPDYDLGLMKPDQTLAELTCAILSGVSKVLDEFKPTMVFVQGDTTTTFVTGLAGFYKNIEVAHLEAGLRSGNKAAPFPEEMNRVATTHLSTYHFAPTVRARDNLAREGVTEKVFVVGNTVIDALFATLAIIQSTGEENYRKYFNFIDFSKKIVLVTGHRRESFGEPLENICHALKRLAATHEDVQIVYPVHLNPRVGEPVTRILNGQSNVHLIAPLEYPYFVWLLNQSYIVLTDSGGIQEEAPAVGKPVLVMRNVTERVEALEAGTAQLVGTDQTTIEAKASALLTNYDEYSKMGGRVNPYGNGHTAEKIVEIIAHEALGPASRLNGPPVSS